MKIETAGAGYRHWTAVLTLIRRSFAYLETRLGHPAKSAELTVEDLINSATDGPVFIASLNAQPIGCLFCRPSRDVECAFYIGRLAVDEAHRGKGLARKLIEVAADHARDAGYTALTLDTGKVLTELHARFERLGFEMLDEDDQPSEIVTMVRSLSSR